MSAVVCWLFPVFSSLFSALAEDPFCSHGPPPLPPTLVFGFIPITMILSVAPTGIWNVFLVMRCPPGSMSGSCQAGDVTMYCPGGRRQLGLGLRLRYWTSEASAKPSCVLFPWGCWLLSLVCRAASAP